MSQKMTDEEFKKLTLKHASALMAQTLGDYEDYKRIALQWADEPAKKKEYEDLASEALKQWNMMYMCILAMVAKTL